MSLLVVLVGFALIVVVLHDGFEVMLVPRRVSRGLRLTRLFYISSWVVWRRASAFLPAGKRRQVALSWFGPSSVILLFSFWAVCLILAFAATHWALESPMNTPKGEPPGSGDYLYFSGVTFFTLGFGDISPQTMTGRFLAVAEAGIGFAFLAVVISYLPVFYQAFSKREATISLLDARAGSPPTAGSLLLRLAPGRNLGVLNRFLENWEQFSAEILETQLSFPLLSYYRSQHDNQSWLAAMTAILDTSALTITALKDVDPYQAQLTFAMARHAVVDLAQVFQARPVQPEIDRLSTDRLQRLLDEFLEAGLTLHSRPEIEPRLAKLRQLYEPFVQALSNYLLLPLPPVWVEGTVVDNWQTSAWMKQSSGIGKLAQDPTDDHGD
jgi:voltage-gated potassium channel Kch